MYAISSSDIASSDIPGSIVTHIIMWFLYYSCHNALNTHLSPILSGREQQHWLSDGDRILLV